MSAQSHTRRWQFLGMFAAAVAAAAIVPALAEDAVDANMDNVVPDDPQLPNAVAAAPIVPALAGDPVDDENVVPDTPQPPNAARIPCVSTKNGKGFCKPTDKCGGGALPLWSAAVECKASSGEVCCHECQKDNSCATACTVEVATDKDTYTQNTLRKYIACQDCHDKCDEQSEAASGIGGTGGAGDWEKVASLTQGQLDAMIGAAEFGGTGGGPNPDSGGTGGGGTGGGGTGGGPTPDCPATAVECSANSCSDLAKFGFCSCVTCAGLADEECAAECTKDSSTDKKTISGGSAADGGTGGGNDSGDGSEKTCHGICRDDPATCDPNLRSKCDECKYACLASSPQGDQSKCIVACDDSKDCDPDAPTAAKDAPTPAKNQEGIGVQSLLHCSLHPPLPLLITSRIFDPIIKRTKLGIGGNCGGFYSSGDPYTDLQLLQAYKDKIEMALYRGLFAGDGTDNADPNDMSASSSAPSATVCEPCHEHKRDATLIAVLVLTALSLLSNIVLVLRAQTAATNAGADAEHAGERRAVGSFDGGELRKSQVSNDGRFSISNI